MGLWLVPFKPQNKYLFPLKLPNKLYIVVLFSTNKKTSEASPPKKQRGPHTTRRSQTSHTRLVSIFRRPSGPSVRSVRGCASWPGASTWRGTTSASCGAWPWTWTAPRKAEEPTPQNDAFGAAFFVVVIVALFVFCFPLFFFLRPMFFGFLLNKPTG